MENNMDIVSTDTGEQAAEQAAGVAVQEKPERSHLALKRTIGIILVILFFALLGVLAVYVGKPLLDTIFGGEGDAAGAFQKIVDDNPLAGRLIYVGVQILQVFIAFIPGEVVEIAGGLAFGAIEGMLLSLLGVAIGSGIIFTLTKTLGMKFVELFVSREKINELRFIRDGRNLEWLVFCVFFIPGTPKDLLTYVVGLTRMKLVPFLAISLLARVPSVLSSTWGGDAIMNGQYTKAIIIFGVALVFSVVGLLLYKGIQKRNKAKAAQDPAGSNTEQA